MWRMHKGFELSSIDRRLGEKIVLVKGSEVICALVLKADKADTTNFACSVGNFTCACEIFCRVDTLEAGAIVVLKSEGSWIDCGYQLTTSIVSPPLPSLSFSFASHENTRISCDSRGGVHPSGVIVVP
ncbi:hypothetical protein C5167_043912 [Papaver somniferum]|uniref:Uncharacterized protein n=1 Tax=Papaver somniferum TaxID=3469 RepID=A0A4Y7L8P3_PAPSO|nr:hypothetical protein C5167_043912 [Papaver somniferum]